MESAFLFSMSTTKTDIGNKPIETTIIVSMEEKLHQIRKAVWEKRPILGEILDKHGNDTLFKYARDYADVNSAPRLDARKPELYSLLHSLITDRLGATVADGVIRQLEKKALISTTDHHGPIDHPFWINSNILSALPFCETEDVALRYNIVFSFASISVNNASAYPRGIVFHGDLGETDQMIRLPFLPDKNKMSVVHCMRGFTREDIEKGKQQLKQKVKGGELTAERAVKIEELINEIFLDEHVLAIPDLNRQISVINYRLWPKLFHPSKKTPDQPSASRLVDLVYIEIETIVAQLLSRIHLKNPSSLLYRLLFTPEYRQLVLERFHDLAGSFSLEQKEEQKRGTYFFWTVDEKLHRVGLVCDGKDLYSEDGRFRYAYTPENVSKGLEEKWLFPNMFACYVIIALYYGMKCLGGFSQVHDLTVIKDAWQEFLKTIGEPEEAEAVAPVQTRELSAGGIVLSYMETNTGELTAATGIDMAIDPDDTRFELYAKLSKGVTLSEMMTPMLPGTYTVMFSAPFRDESLASLSSALILHETGVEQKLREQFVQLHD